MRKTTQLRTLMRLAREERGSALVEFAVTGVLLMTMVMGVIEFAMVMYAYHFVSTAAQMGARYAIVRGADWSTSCSTSAPPNFTLSYGCKAASSDVQNYVKSVTNAGLSSANVSATATWPGTTPDCTSGCSACATANSQGCLVQVQVTYAFAFLPVVFLPQSTLHLTSTTNMVIQE